MSHLVRLLIHDPLGQLTLTITVDRARCVPDRINNRG
jgi:hypothetical protein